MSRSWTERVEIALAPQKIALLRRHRLTGKVLHSTTLDCEPSDDTAAPWQGALAALLRAVNEPRWQHAPADVVLSNHFVRYAIVASAAGVTSATEEAALVAHRFNSIFGNIAQTWAIRTSPAGADQLIAAAIDQTLLSSLDDLMQIADLNLISTEPLLMTAFNRLRQRMHGEPFWYVMIEPGKACLAGLSGQAWRVIEAQRIGDDVTSELPRLIEQAALTHDKGIDSKVVLVDAPHLRRLDLISRGPWQMIDAKTLQRGSGPNALSTMTLALN